MDNIPDIDQIKASFSNVNDLEFIQQGGFKAVYKINIGNREEALKVIFIPNSGNEEISSIELRLIREIKILEELDSPFTVKLGSIAPEKKVIDGHNYICYSEEFLEGNSVRTEIKKNRSIPYREIKRLFICLLATINEFKRIGVVHRDIKPDNIIKTGVQGREYVLLDLGLAFIREGTNLTPDTRAIPGTPLYLAPEMLKTGFRERLNFRADLYSAALTTYEYAVLHNPFENPRHSIYQTLLTIGSAKIDQLENLRPDFPAYFCKMINQSLKRIPAIRPGNIDKLLHDLEERE